MLVFELDGVLILPTGELNEVLINTVLVPAIRLRDARKIDAIILLTNNDNKEYINNKSEVLKIYCNEMLNSNSNSNRSIFDYTMRPSHAARAASNTKNITHLTYILNALNNHKNIPNNRRIPFKTDAQILEQTYLFDKEDSDLSRTLRPGHFYKPHIVPTNTNTTYVDMNYEYNNIYEYLEEIEQMAPRPKISSRVLGGTRKKTRKHKTKKRRAY